jgi:hypothetical protein
LQVVAVVETLTNQDLLDQVDQAVVVLVEKETELVEQQEQLTLAVVAEEEQEWVLHLGPVVQEKL